MKIVVAAVALLVAAAAHGQSGFPSRPVRLIVPFPPGQATDIVARLVSEGLGKLWAQGVVVENRGGGAGIPGMIAGRDAPPDGHTITVGTSGTVAINPGMHANLPYDPLRDFAMVNGLFTVPLMIVAHPGAPYRSLQDLIDAAKKNPGKLNWGLPGSGTSQHLTGELLKMQAGIDIVAVLYKGSGPAMTDLLGGQITLMVDSLASSLPHIKAGKIRPLAMTTAQRAPQLPELPTVAELGYPGFDGVGWGGMMVPKATPGNVVERIGADVRRVLGDPVIQARIIERGAVPDPRDAKEFAEFVNAELVKWTTVIQKANVRAE